MDTTTIQPGVVSSFMMYIPSEKEIRSQSAINVRTGETTKGDNPISGGLNDPLMGTCEYMYNCGTCRNNRENCPGHFGSTDLNYPVKSPFFYDEIFNWLRIICHYCGYPLGPFNSFMSSNELSALTKKFKPIEKCQSCNKARNTVSREPLRRTSFRITKPDETTEVLLNTEIKEILERIPDHLLTKWGISTYNNPKNMILTTIPIAPNTLRPDFHRINGVKNNTSDTTILLKFIISTNRLIPKRLPPKNSIPQQMMTYLNNLDLNYYTMIKGKSSGNLTFSIGSNPPASISDRLIGKDGRVVRNIMGRRAGHMARSVITGNPNLKLDEVGIPLSFAKTLYVPEKITVFNRDRLMQYFNNGIHIYPGCKKIIKAATRGEYRREYLDNYVLQVGDTVMRDLIDGDIVLFNRQPSLWFTSVVGMKVIVINNSMTLQLNPAICAYFNADFDGDQMNVIHMESISARCEASHMSAVSRWIISPQTLLCLGAFQDGLLGIAEMTKGEYKYDKWHAMQMFANIDNQQVDTSFVGNLFTNRNIVSRLLPPINISKTPEYFKEQYAPYMKYDPDDIRVIIERGELKSGILDKATVGQGQSGSIIHIIANTYGNPRALQTVFDIQQISIAFLNNNGYTIGIDEICINEDAKDEIAKRFGQMAYEAHKITDNLNSGKLVPPLGMSMHNFYESSIINALTPSDDIILPILRSIDQRSSNMFRMILYGSKGNTMNYFNINGALGLVVINGKRMQQHAGIGRVFPYALRYDDQPEINGFIDSSYQKGLRVEELISTAADTRFGLITISLSTSITGALNRIIMKNAESIVVDNLLKAIKNNNVIQVLCYENGIDPSKLERVTFATIEISDEELEKRFKLDAKALPKKYQTTEVKNALQSEFDQIVADRKLYRDIHLRLEAANPGGFIMSAQKHMPLNLARIIDNAVFQYNHKSDEKSGDDFDPIYIITIVKEICANIGYLYYNDSYRARGGKISKVVDGALTFVRILIRTYMSTSYLRSKNVKNWHMDMIVADIFKTYSEAIIHPHTMVGIISVQSICEKFTQYMLGSKHRSGGAGGTKTNAVTRMREITDMKKTENMANPHMVISVVPELENNKIKVQEIATRIEMMQFGRFVQSYHICFEAYGKPDNGLFDHEAKIIENITKYNAGLAIPADLAKWCIRFGLNREEMIFKSISIETIVFNLRKTRPDLFIINSPENSKDLFIRVYLRNSYFTQSNDYVNTNVKPLIDKLKDVLVRGIEGIRQADVVDLVCNRVDEKGALVRKKVIGITTTGTNIDAILGMEGINSYSTQSDSLEDVANIFGINTTRSQIVHEMISTMPTLNQMSCKLLANAVCYTGVQTSIQRTGMGTREYANIGLQMSFQALRNVMKKAAADAHRDRLERGSISGRLIVGDVPDIGTLANDVVINYDFIKEQNKDFKQRLNDL